MCDSSCDVNISVVMSVHNGKEYLEDSVKSILSQTFSEFELIILDDFSTDGSSQILVALAETDSRIRLLKNESNLGLTKSLNIGIGAAKGKYIVRMDADDICMPERIEAQLAYMSKNNAVDLVYADTLLIDKHADPICRSWRPSTVDKVLDCLETHNFIPHPTVMFKKSTFDQVGGYDERCRTGQDLNLWLRMRDQGCHFGYLNQVVLKYRLNPLSVRAYLSDYWFVVANYCIWNGKRSGALRYFNHLSLKQKIFLLIKMLLPFSYFIGKYK